VTARAVVLMYHRLGEGRLADREPGEDVYAVTPDAFAAQMEALAASACTVVPFERAAAGGDLPPRAVAITFDDGNATDHSAALPVLRRFGYPATFFVIPAAIGRPGFLGWEEVAELASAGMTVGGHGLDHTLLSTLQGDTLREHLAEAHRRLAERLGAPPSCISLPGGAGGAVAIAACRQAGFQWVGTSVPRRAGGGRPESGVPRFAVRRGDGLGELRALVEQRPLALARHEVRHRLLGGLRAVLGGGVYARLRRAWAERPDPA
jgi:peptidoglycan/xylan/chitin deacetylase (PgdA/CDA1 family)